MQGRLRETGLAAPEEVRQVRGSEGLMEPDKDRQDRLDRLSELRDLDEAGEFAETDQKILWTLEHVRDEMQANGKRLDAIQATIKQGFDDVVSAIENRPEPWPRNPDRGPQITPFSEGINPDLLGQGDNR